MRERRRLRVSGAVQGVGFRPHVYRLAQSLQLGGMVCNAASGVVIEVEGPPAALDRFTSRVLDEAPVASAISAISGEGIAALGEREFHIGVSIQAGDGGVLLGPDLATCPECARDVLAPAGRYVGYPFTACTACGPRFSVIEALPYDRARTSLQGFPLCPDCARAYADPANRRFHAQTQACPACGPQLSLQDRDGRMLAAGDAAWRVAATRVREGGIVAVKGIGGFHLLARADDAAAVAALRARKRRPTQPFAVLFADAAMVAAWCELSAAEAAALASPAAPIVLLRQRPGCGAAEGVAPGRRRLGAMLAYAPLHHLLMRALGAPVVATSANLSGAPLLFRDADMSAACADLADAVLTHDRPILRPVEDSVVQVVAGAARVLRLGRGLAPLAVPLTGNAPPLLALGGTLKNAPAVTLQGTALLGPQLGDLDHPNALAAHRALVEDLCRMHGVRPACVACDAHPDDTTALDVARRGLPVVRVPHHLAHVAAAMAEHDLTGPVLGLAWDGAGYGTDGTVWGGEFLLVEGAQWRRVGRFRPFRLPGGDAAAREPLRAAVGVLAGIYGDDLAAWPAAARARLGPELPALLAVARSARLSPLTSSAGRLFDAVSGLLGLCCRNSFEAEAAMALEDCAAGCADAGPGYPFALTQADPSELDWRPALRALLDDLTRDADRGAIAGRFYRGLMQGAVTLALRTGVRDVVLTGGCFQGWLLASHMAAALADSGLSVYLHRRVPPGDGGLALGQLEWVRRRAVAA